ncbi:hypothetical protein E2C01_065548 [Portunus trituberculatus]|uniref:Uncharacterized protein n=1 Tax=Portunus trituberculatus TaxID=210409 RepID=A0A5B7HMV3_PORTR|nr:hypothetical protein [Portunus trituberculatus]
MDVIAELRHNMALLKGERRAAGAGSVLGADSPPHGSGIGTAADTAHPVSSNVPPPGLRGSTGSFSGFKSDPAVSDEEGELVEEAQSCSVLLPAAKSFGPTDDVSEDVEKDVAAMVNHLVTNGMRAKDYKDILDDDITKQPSNCQVLSPVECKVQVLDTLNSEARKSDFCLKKVSKDIVKAASIVVKSQTILDRVANDEGHSVVAQEVTRLNGTLALLGNANFRNNLT